MTNTHKAEFNQRVNGSTTREEWLGRAARLLQPEIEEAHRPNRQRLSYRRRRPRQEDSWRMLGQVLDRG